MLEQVAAPLDVLMSGLFPLPPDTLGMITALMF
jgi:hypothetical protein